MTTYLIDYENTGYHGLEGFTDLEREDSVVVFTGALSGKSSIPLDVVKLLTAEGTRPTLRWQHSKKTGRNYLDLQLCSYLGWLIGKESVREKNFVIVSKDRDFGAAVDLWDDSVGEGVNVVQQPTIAGHPIPARRGKSTKAKQPPKAQIPNKKAQPTVDDAVRKQVRSAVKPLDLKPNQYALIYRALASSKTSQDLHTRLTKSFPQPLGTETYHAVKDFLANSAS